jgi:hypothetical protein
MYSFNHRSNNYKFLTTLFKNNNLLNCCVGGFKQMTSNATEKVDFFYKNLSTERGQNTGF